MRQATGIPVVDTAPPNIFNSGRKPWQIDENKKKAFLRRRKFKIIERHERMLERDV